MAATSSPITSKAKPTPVATTTPPKSTPVAPATPPKSTPVTRPPKPTPQIQADFLPLYRRLRRDHPSFTIKPGPKFAFRPPKTILLGPPQPNYALLALHELAHALCGHHSFSTHVQRLKIESEAWQRAKTLCAKYHIYYDEDFVETQLDTYRNWLHQKSTCPHCGLTRFQTPDRHYHCPHCDLLL